MSEVYGYYAYENWTDRGWSTPRRVNVHREDCGHMKDEQRERARKNDIRPNDRWHFLGKFDSPQRAMQEAKERVGERDTTFCFCGNCLRGIESACSS